MRTYFALLLAISLCTCVRAQTHSELALKAYLANDSGLWEKAIAATDGISDPKEKLLLRAKYSLNSIYAAMAKDDNEGRDVGIDRADAALDAYWELDEENAAAHGLYSALLGLKIARKPMMGMIYGSRASNYAEKALKLDENSPAALYSAAGNLYYTPEMWGGDPALALTYLERAVQQYGTDRNNNFEYLETLALMGQVQAKLGHADAARSTYALALEAQPDFYYVSKVLLPQLDK